MLPSNILMSLAISGMLTSQLLKFCSERNAKQNLRLLLALTSGGLCSADCKVMFLKHISMSWWAVELTMRRGWQQKISAFVSVYSLLLFLRLKNPRKGAFYCICPDFWLKSNLACRSGLDSLLHSCSHAWKYCASVLGASWRLTVASFCCTCPVYWSYFNDICWGAPVFFILLSL